VEAPTATEGSPPPPPTSGDGGAKPEPPSAPVDPKAKILDLDDPKVRKHLNKNQVVIGRAPQ
jgi:hypothetical protein